VESNGESLAWSADRNATARRIAGRVTYRGAPVKDAVVSLHSMPSRAHVVAPIELRTDANGRFDFGTRAPAMYFVAASSPNTTAAIIDLSLADPTLKPTSEQLELQLGECSAVIEGTIYDASENPLPKMHVRRGGSYGSGLVGVETDERGRYRLCMPVGEVAVEYGGDGFGAVRLTIDVSGETHRDVVLVPEATLTVHVLRADGGAPVADAYVIVGTVESGPDRPALAYGVTDKDGEVRISGLVPGRYGVFGRADGGLQSQAPTEALAQVGVGTDVIVRLAGSARITGKVVDGTTPVAGAQVRAIRKLPGGGMGGAIGFSQADGSFVVDHVFPGEVEFTASPFEVDSPTSLIVEAGKSYEGLVLEVKPLATIRGRVTRLGKPVAGVNVCCVTSVVPSSVATDAEGKFEFIGVAPDKYAIAAVSDAIGAGTVPKTITMKSGEQRTLDFELDIAGTIAGVVVDRDGKPVQGVFVRWLHAKTGDPGQCVTDAHGRYRCGAMTGGGAYRPAVFPSPDATEPYQSADGASYPEVDLKDSRTVIENVTLAIDRPRRAISGRVLDESGGPVADAIVKALPIPDGQPATFSSWQRLPSTSTDADGRFSIRDLDAARYAVQARVADGSEGVAPSVGGGTDNVTIRIERAGSVEGKLVRFKDTPTIMARPLGEARLVPGTVDGATFRVAGLRPGRYLVTAQTSSEGEARTIDVRPGQITRTDLTSHGHATIEGTVFDFRTRAAIANASCQAVVSVDGNPVIPNWDLSGAAKSDASGQFRIDPTPAGSVTVMCRTAGLRWTPSAADVTVVTGGRAVVQLASVENTSENPSTIGIDFDWNATAPRISGVLPNSPAAKAGIAIGDLVTQVNGAAVEGLNGAGVQRLIESVQVGDEVRLTALRGVATKTFSVRTVAGH
jgi:protocatechuate 3,4-dioxygenase beta subunit